MPKIFVQGEVGADRSLRRDAAHSVEMGDAHGEALACVLVSEGVGEPEFGSMVACEFLHEIVRWTEENVQAIIKESGYELDVIRFLAGLSTRVALAQMMWGDGDGDLPLHFAYLVAYKGDYLVVRVGEAKVFIMGESGRFEVGADPAAEHVILAQSALAAPVFNALSGTRYEFHSGHYDEGDLFLAMTPGLWDRLGQDGLVSAYANYQGLDEASLSELTAGLICEMGEDGGSDGLSLAGVEMLSFTPYQKLGITVG